MNTTDLCNGFGISKSTGATKARVVRNTLGMAQLDVNWCLPSKMDDNTMAWLITVNEMITDARHLPRELQEIAYKKGIISYIPADKKCMKD